MNLKQLHNLNIVYEETKGDIAPFLKLYRLSKAKGIGVKQVVNLLEIANNDLPSIEEQFKKAKKLYNYASISKTYRREKFITVEQSNSINKQALEFSSYVL